MAVGEEDYIEKILVGWREWLALPELGIPGIKAKIDSGARTSAIHTFELDAYRDKGAPKVRFAIHPLQRNTNIEIYCEADVVDRRLVRDSGGHQEKRFVIQTTFQLGGVFWDAEITLTNRDNMVFRMLLGRTAMANHFVIDPAKSYLTGRTLSKVYKHMKK